MKAFTVKRSSFIVVCSALALTVVILIYILFFYRLSFVTSDGCLMYGTAHVYPGFSNRGQILRDLGAPDDIIVDQRLISADSEAMTPKRERWIYTEPGREAGVWIEFRQDADTVYSTGYSRWSVLDMIDSLEWHDATK